MAQATTANGLIDDSKSVSPPLRISLEMGGRTFNVAATAPDWLILRDPSDLPPGNGTLHVDIDGDVRSETLHFGDGISGERRRQPHDRRPRASQA